MSRQGFLLPGAASQGQASLQIHSLASSGQANCSDVALLSFGKGDARAPWPQTPDARSGDGSLRLAPVTAPNSPPA
jgi:hypothetical protein